MFVNLNLSGPQGVDAHGRVLYGALRSNGMARPARVADGKFPEATDLRNHSLGHSWSVTAEVDKPFADRLELRASYTQSALSGSAIAYKWIGRVPCRYLGTARPVSGRHDDFSTGVSAFEIPQRVVLAATYVSPWKRWKTDLSLYYI